MKYKYEKHTYTKLKLKYNEEMRDWKPEVRWFYGSSDSEKTQAAKDWLGDNIYTVTNNDKFWVFCYVFVVFCYVFVVFCYQQMLPLFHVIHMYYYTHLLKYRYNG
jgi:hypothetical protein